jgi:hypothetical protein
MAVVLPAPLGPSRATVWPRPTGRLRLSTACTDPKERETPLRTTASPAVWPLPATPTATGRAWMEEGVVSCDQPGVARPVTVVRPVSNLA